jgi:hypothetical protein
VSRALAGGRRGRIRACVCGATCCLLCTGISRCFPLSWVDIATLFDIASDGALDPVLSPDPEKQALLRCPLLNYCCF